MSLRGTARQNQSITTTIANICKYYPARSIFRELLQNADDAGATEVEFVLDTRSYDNRPLLHAELGQFEGPALLVYNNSLFQKEDFGSLASIGSSIKLHDPTSTGKFGQGFNSVFHYTDAPSIFSGDSLLLLDPHHSWTRSLPPEYVGGPIYSTNEESQDDLEGLSKVQNHLKAFSAFSFDSFGFFNGTIIRIPLRTEEQAQASEIVKKSATLADIVADFSAFARELEDGGIIFARHVSSVRLRVDAKNFASTKIIGPDVIEAKEKINKAFRALFAPDKGFDPPQQNLCQYNFQAILEHTFGATTKQTEYIVVHQLRKSCGDQELDEWAKEQKLFPCVGMAAPVKVRHPMRDLALIDLMPTYYSAEKTLKREDSKDIFFRIFDSQFVQTSHYIYTVSGALLLTEHDFHLAHPAPPMTSQSNGTLSCSKTAQPQHGPIYCT
ncbi:MAG: hypothetical protein M1819_005661 [Sarea resinae]|nr:MAG: hypothetical protein M1819_005661 [Sarea resinae]